MSLPLLLNSSMTVLHTLALNTTWKSVEESSAPTCIRSTPSCRSTTSGNSSSLLHGLERALVLRPNRLVRTSFGVWTRRRTRRKCITVSYVRFSISLLFVLLSLGSQPKALNKSNLCAGYKFVATPRKSDKADLTRQSVDMGMYPTSLAPKRPADGSHPRMDWSTVEIPIECKNHPTQEDPFDDSALDGAPAAELRKAALGQILSYAELVFRYQQRSHLFLVYFLGDFVRLIFIDHGGLYVTHKLNYKEKGEKIAEFFWRYSRMTPTERGHDPTAVRVTHDSKLGQEMKRMAQPPKKIDERDYIRDMFKQSLDYKWPWWCLSVPVVSNEGTPEEVFNRKFLVGKPHFQAPGVAGRATRGYVALPLNYNDEVEGPFVYLKDAWRVAREGREREGSILAELNELKVQSVPTLVCHGDIPGQATISQKIWPAYHPDAEDCPLKLHQHYRLVVKEVGKPLDQFKNGFELVYALFCCIEGE